MPVSSRTRPRSQDPLYVIADGTLCRLRVWSEAEWAALPDNRRPLEFVHAPGLGWVGAAPIDEAASLSTSPTSHDRHDGDRMRVGLGPDTERSRRQRRGPDRRRMDGALASVGTGSQGNH
jgi:hypothetical protein